MDNDHYLSASEIFYTIILFVLCFMVTEILLSYFGQLGVYRRFIIRVAFLVQYSALIYLLFDHLDSQERLKHYENPPENPPQTHEPGETDDMTEGA